MSELIDRQAAIDALHMHLMYRMGTDSNKKRLDDWINGVPSVQETHEKRTETHACDCIERQAAIDALDKRFDSIPMEQTTEILQLRKDLRELPSVQPEQRWIPCSERLPEVHESGNSFSGIYMQSVPALVYGICEGEGNAQFHVATYCDDLDGNTYWSTELDAFTITEVKAWMPLPAPWKGEQP